MRKAISRLLKYGTLLSCYLLIASVLLQIYARFFLENTPSWTEETSRLFFIYTIAFAAGLAVKNDYYVYLDVVFEKLKPLTQKRLLVIIHITTFLLFGIICAFSLELIQLGFSEKSPSMGMPMAVSFISIFIMSASVSYYAVLEIVKALKNLNR